MKTGPLLSKSFETKYFTTFLINFAFTVYLNFMGDLNVNKVESEARAAFTEHLLNDIRALEIMLERNLFESGITRIGSEQEFCLVTDNWRPSDKWEQVLEAIDDAHFTTELARYNLELNLDPMELKGQAFSEMEHNLRSFMKKAAAAAEKHNDKIVLAGVLPTISKREVSIDYMTPLPRYRSLNEMIRSLRGTDIELHIRGIDELSLIHDSVMFEACNTSFQTHLQIDPGDFINSFNWAQAIAGPILSVCANSPLLMGRELWAETRIALFQQSIDTRKSSYALKEQHPRVSFGDNWAEESIATIYKNDIANHRVLLSKEMEQDSLQELEAGKMPKLKALALHSGTIYHWNRPCFGIHNDVAHLRIENRYLPAGPTITDEIANFALWVGLMKGRPEAYDDIRTQMEFRDAKSNFIKAARTGRESVMRWMGEHRAARELMQKTLLPLAYAGLQNSGIEQADIEKYLGIIEERCKGNTGSQWIVENYRSLKKEHSKDDALKLLTRAMYKNQKAHIPVHSWPAIDPELEAHEASHLIDHIMSSQLFTVEENDLADLATEVMNWKNIHHMPVENSKGQLTGLLTWTHMQKFREHGCGGKLCRVKDIMAKDLITVRPDTEIKSAIALMKRNEIGCLPVVHDHHLVGIITVKDVLPFDHD